MRASARQRAISEAIAVADRQLHDVALVTTTLPGETEATMRKVRAGLRSPWKFWLRWIWGSIWRAAMLDEAAVRETAGALRFIALILLDLIDTCEREALAALTPHTPGRAA